MLLQQLLSLHCAVVHVHEGTTVARGPQQQCSESLLALFAPQVELADGFKVIIAIPERSAVHSVNTSANQSSYPSAMLQTTTLTTSMPQ